MVDDELKRLLEAMRQENAAGHVETRRYSEAVAAEMQRGLREENAAAHAETRHYFDIVTEGLKHEIRLVAESVAHVDEKLDREATDIRDEMRRGFSETQAMIKFSHVELDRRIRSLEQSQSKLEETLSDLEARIERLESPTH